MDTAQTAITGRIDGTAYSVRGTGEPVVLVHGVGLEKSAWAAQVSDLARDFQVVTYDTLGHGGSRVPSDDVDLGDYARQLLVLMDHLQLPAANVVGHSMGALVALEFAITFPARTLRVAALNGVFMRGQKESEAALERARVVQNEGVQQYVEPTIARWFGDPVPPELQSAAEWVRDTFAALDPPGYARAYRVFATSDRTNADRLPDLTMPALFTTGEFDGNSTPAMSGSMAALARNAQCEIVEGAKHMMNMTHPQRVNASLRRFLARPVAGSAGPGPGALRRATT